ISGIILIKYVLTVGQTPVCFQENFVSWVGCSLESFPLFFVEATSEVEARSHLAIASERRQNTGACFDLSLL
ncbi:MAG: hypothetical protein L6276_07685, partial [Acetobacterium sp.]|nr:hypothetical protein [Acetobacterium sp.]